VVLYIWRPEKATDRIIAALDSRRREVLVDVRLAIVGSMNLDPLSLNLLEEGSLAVEDPKAAAELAAAFERDGRAPSASRSARRRSPASGARWSGKSSARWGRLREGEAEPGAQVPWFQLLR